jgi:hypothetical protein
MREVHMPAVQRDVVNRVHVALTEWRDVEVRGGAEGKARVRARADRDPRSAGRLVPRRNVRRRRAATPADRRGRSTRRSAAPKYSALPSGATANDSVLTLGQQAGFAGGG